VAGGLRPAAEAHFVRRPGEHYTMTPALESALRALAAPAAEQRARYDSELCAADQLVLDFELAMDDAFDVGAPRMGTLPVTVIAFDQFLRQCSRDEDFRTDAALFSSSDWKEIREAAAETLDSLAARDDETPADG
jgi:hypothetical protein